MELGTIQLSEFLFHERVFLKKNAEMGDSGKKAHELGSTEFYMSGLRSTRLQFPLRHLNVNLEMQWEITETKL